jgi:RNA polymerase sigma factor (TIGR02999 family)
MMGTPGDITQLLRRWQLDGDSDAEQEIFRVVQHELLAIARRMLRGELALTHKIEPRELVNEAYVALHGYSIATPNRAPFFRLMGKAMKHVLIDLARKGRAEKRPPSRLRVVDTTAMHAVGVTSELDVLEFYDSLDALRAINARQADTVELRILGLENKEIAEEHKVSEATVKRDMSEARAFLAFRLGLAPDWIQP